MKSIIFGDAPVSIMDALFITVVCMLIVFSVLLLISYSLNLLKLFNPKEESKDGQNKPNQRQDSKQAVNTNASGATSTASSTNNVSARQSNVDYNDFNVRLAIFVASIAAAEEFGHDNIKIRSVREI